MPLPSAGPHLMVVGSGWPFSVTEAVTLMTYGLAGANREDLLRAETRVVCVVELRLPSASPPPFSDATVNGARASVADSAGSSTASVNGSGESAGAWPAMISSGWPWSSRYFLSFQPSKHRAARREDRVHVGVVDFDLARGRRRDRRRGRGVRRTLALHRRRRIRLRRAPRRWAPPRSCSSAQAWVPAVAETAPGSRTGPGTTTAPR